LRFTAIAVYTTLCVAAIQLCEALFVGVEFVLFCRKKSKKNFSCKMPKNAVKKLDSLS
jgi:hypothetical protein